VPLPRSTTPAEPTTPRLLPVSSMLPPHFPRRRLQRLMNFGALSRGFGTCCLRFKNGVATTHAKLASGWLARLYREGVEPSGSLQKVSDHPSSFSGLILAQGKFHWRPPPLHARKWARARDASVAGPHNDDLSGMPADGINLPPKKGTSACPAGPARRLGYINHATGRKGA
jgi:hypothetical protein